MKYQAIYIIYNPKSTGDSESMAKSFAKNLRQELPSVTIKCLATQYAGHASKIAHRLASDHDNPLIISSSGDGGYNEIINGVMEAGNNKAICAVLPAGNANDHSRTMQDGTLLRQILKAKTTRLDLLKACILDTRGGQTAIYAHSYIGLGLTPVIATELNKNTLNAFRETIIVIKTFLKHRPFKIRHDGKLLKLDSLLLSNINQMAKVLTLAPRNRPADGKFEVIALPSGHKLRLIKSLFKAAAFHLENVPSTVKYELEVIKDMPMQADGEITKLRAGSHVKITIAPKALLTIV